MLLNEATLSLVASLREGVRVFSVGSSSEQIVRKHDLVLAITGPIAAQAKSLKQNSCIITDYNRIFVRSNCSGSCSIVAYETDDDAPRGLQGNRGKTRSFTYSHGHFVVQRHLFSKTSTASQNNIAFQLIATLPPTLGLPSILTS